MNLLPHGFGGPRPIFQEQGLLCKPITIVSSCPYESAPARLWRPAAHIPGSRASSQTYYDVWLLSMAHAILTCMCNSHMHGCCHSPCMCFCTWPMRFSHNWTLRGLRVYIIPQTDLSVGVLTVLVKGPWLRPCSVDGCHGAQTLLFLILRHLTLKNTM